MNDVSVVGSGVTGPYKSTSTPRVTTTTTNTPTVRSYLSQLSLMRAATGDTRLSPESFAAIQEGAPPPEIHSPESEKNAESLENTAYAQDPLSPPNKGNKETEQIVTTKNTMVPKTAETKPPKPTELIITTSSYQASSTLSLALTPRVDIVI